MKDNEEESAVDLSETALDTMSIEQLVPQMLMTQSAPVLALASQRGSLVTTVRAVAARFARGGRIIYVGAGTSGRLAALDASEIPPTFGVAPDRVVAVMAGGDSSMTVATPTAEDDGLAGRRDLQFLNLTSSDAVIGVTSSGQSLYVENAMKFAKECGAFVAVLCGCGNTRVSAHAEVFIPLNVGPEFIEGSTRLNSGTAIKMALNTISTCVMITGGKTYGRHMVNVSPTNRKLRQRAVEIVSTLATVDSMVAEELLVQCDYEVDTAVVCANRAVSVESARVLLSESGGRLRRVIDNRPARPPRQTKRSSREFVLGIDAGGSNTVAILRPIAGHTTKVEGRGLAGMGNVSNSVTDALEQISKAIELARDGANCDSGPFASACLAVAGSGAPALREEILEWAKGKAIAHRVHVCTDAYAVLDLVCPSAPGVILIAGTGSISYGRDMNGRTIRSGGWGWVTSNCSDAVGIGLQALKVVGRAIDGLGEPTSLVDALIEAKKSPNIGDVLRKYCSTSVDTKEIAEIARIVDRAANSGDEASTRILESAADELFALAMSVHKRLGTRERAPIGLAGGVLTNSRTVGERLIRRLEESGAFQLPPLFVREPVIGSVDIALRQLEAEEDM